MKKTNLRNQIYVGASQKKSTYDLEITAVENKKCVVFMHGYMGFKDWGCWNLVHQKFVDNGFNFAKFNVSHNGTSLDNQTEFVDLDSFGKNSYWRELKDLNLFLEHLEFNYGLNEVHLIGHSRGGGMVLLGSKHKNVKSVTTWAAISSLEKRMPTDEKLKAWNSDGVYYVQNGRTNQQMPHYFSQYEEYLKHRDELDIESRCKHIEKPLCIIHGTADLSVGISESEVIKELTNAEFHAISGANHTFDSKHPWENLTLPNHLEEVYFITKNFISTHYQK